MTKASFSFRVCCDNMISERELPDDLPFYVGDVIGSGAFARYFLQLCACFDNLVYALLETNKHLNYTR